MSSYVSPNPLPLCPLAIFLFQDQDGRWPGISFSALSKNAIGNGFRKKPIESQSGVGRQNAVPGGSQDTERKRIPGNYNYLFLLPVGGSFCRLNSLLSLFTLSL